MSTGVSVHRSQNLVDWEFAGYALEAACGGWRVVGPVGAGRVCVRGIFTNAPPVATSRPRTGTVCTDRRARDD